MGMTGGIIWAGRGGRDMFIQAINIASSSEDKEKMENSDA